MCSLMHALLRSVSFVWGSPIFLAPSITSLCIHFVNLSSFHLLLCPSLQNVTFKYIQLSSLGFVHQIGVVPRDLEFDMSIREHREIERTDTESRWLGASIVQSTITDLGSRTRMLWGCHFRAERCKGKVLPARLLSKSRCNVWEPEVREPPSLSCRCKRCR